MLHGRPAGRQERQRLAGLLDGEAVTVINDVRLVLGMELLCACQGVDLRGNFKPGRALRPVSVYADRG